MGITGGEAAGSISPWSLSKKRPLMLNCKFLSVITGYWGIDQSNSRP